MRLRAFTSSVHAVALALALAAFPACSQEHPGQGVTFACDDGSTIQATFFNRRVKIEKSGTPPLTLSQTISADGARYANGSESFVFWTRGNGAFIEKKEPDGSTRRTHCILVPQDPGGLPNLFENSSAGFSLRYPEGWSVDRSYVYSELGPENLIRGVAFGIPASMSAGTNLAPDTCLSVELMPNASDDSAASFLPGGVSASTITRHGVTYSYAMSIGAGAGNRYEERVYAIQGTRPLMAVRYFIHYAVIENYPPGTVREFDRRSLLHTFDRIRRTLTIDEANVPGR